MRLLREDRAWDDCLYWQKQDRKTLKRIDDANRIVCYEEDGIVHVVACRDHYD